MLKSLYAEDFRMNDDFLNTLKKHIDSGAIVPNEMSKTQIHNFGESMKGINEFIGAVQVLNINLAKVKNLSEKIEWIDEMLKSEKNDSTTAMLKMQKSTHIANLKYVVDGTKFIGVALFGTQLSCVVNGREFALCVENPLNHNAPLAYCAQKLDEINALTLALNQRLNSDDLGADSALSQQFSQTMPQNLFAK
ncbi:flagellar FLiS export co-chaperone [Helicobacter sp. 23-1045]